MAREEAGGVGIGSFITDGFHRKRTELGTWAESEMVDEVGDVHSFETLHH